MSDRSAPLSCRFIRRRVGGRNVWPSAFVLLLVSGKLVLPFQLEFEFGLRQIGLKLLVLLDEFADLLPLGIDGAVQVAMVLFVLVSLEHQDGDRGTARVRVIPDIGARIVLDWIKRVPHVKSIRDFHNLSSLA
jgi:hypothetical protein